MTKDFIKEYKFNLTIGLLSGLATGLTFLIGQYFGDKIGGTWGFLLSLLLVFAITIGMIIYIAKMKIK